MSNLISEDHPLCEFQGKWIADMKDEIMPDKKIYTVEVSRDKIKLIGVIGENGYIDYPFLETLEIDPVPSMIRDLQRCVEIDIINLSDKEEIDWSRPIEYLFGSKWVDAKLVYIGNTASVYNHLIVFRYDYNEDSNEWVTKEGFWGNANRIVIRNKEE